MIEFLRKFENRSIKIARVNSIFITKYINSQLFTLILDGFGVRCDLRQFSVLSQFIEKYIFELVTVTTTKPRLSGKQLPNMNTCENGWSNFSESLRLVALKLLGLIQFTSYSTIYLNLLRLLPPVASLESLVFYRVHLLICRTTCITYTEPTVYYDT